MSSLPRANGERLMITPDICPPCPPSIHPDRWKKMHENCHRVERLTGICPFNGDGWEKVAVILMDMLEAAKKPRVRKKAGA